MNEEYAQQITRDWNPKDAASGYAGFVTRFNVDNDYVARFPVQTVGHQSHQELWVPSEELETFNSYSMGLIEVVGTYYGIPFQNP